jgi:putative membrane protein
MYFYIKALHIIFIVTWFSGLFYIVRLFIYNTEAGQKEQVEREILRSQFSVMIKRLWLGITWPSAVLTLIFGPWMLVLYGSVPGWLWIKISFVVLLYMYHFSLHVLYRQQRRGVFKYTSQQLRVWNELATVFLISIVMLVVVKSGLSVAWSLSALLLLIVVLMAAIRIYKGIRKSKEPK